MKTIYADFNALTADEHISLETQGSRDDMRGLGVEVGDRVWLSDGELVVGSRVVLDPDQGIVGVPEWETLVHLDSNGDRQDITG